MPHQSKVLLLTLLLFLNANTSFSAEESKLNFTPYEPQKVIFDFYFDQPDKINSALYWIRSLITPLMDSPYNYAPEFMDIKIMIHGTEIVTLAKKNYSRYKTVVERMRYYDSLGIQFKVCSLAAHDFGYTDKDFYDFIQVVPSAMTELVHWQMQGYGLITPRIYDKKFSTDEIR
ncbi:hypothetical protein MNBD_GAMMA23-1509 [hydrothermal vent metagenome]|uniref:Uncharacterized protein n=1 Tax=hydrothermal vent metagenome TaxID=652676 RepID=A0A3B1AA42_9ZZZZ